MRAEGRPGAFRHRNKKDIKKRLGILRDLKVAFKKAWKRSKGKRIIADVAEQLDRQRKLGKNGVACLLEECGLQPSDFILLEAKTLLAFDKGSQPLIEKALDSALGGGTIRGNGLNNPFGEGVSDDDAASKVAGAGRPLLRWRGRALIAVSAGRRLSALGALSNPKLQGSGAVWRPLLLTVLAMLCVVLAWDLWHGTRWGWGSAPLLAWLMLAASLEKYGSRSEPAGRPRCCCAWWPCWCFT